MATDGCWTLRCFTVMPDHVHLFFTLGERLTLSQAVARLKTKTHARVRLFGTDWQNNFYDHKIRPNDSMESITRYIYLNPYQAGLIPLIDIWPYFYCCEEDRKWFDRLTGDRLPFPGWLQWRARLKRCRQLKPIALRTKRGATSAPPTYDDCEP